jgi:hypothetical protein
MGGEVIIINRSSNLWALERVMQTYETPSTSKPTVWDHLVIAAGATERLDVRDPGTYVFKVVDTDQVSHSAILVTQPERGEACLTLSWNPPPGTFRTVDAALRLESGSRVAITKSTFNAAPHPPSAASPQPTDRSRPWTPLPPPPTPSLPAAPVEPMGQPRSMPPTAPTPVLDLEADQVDGAVDSKSESGGSRQEGGGEMRDRRSPPPPVPASSGTAISHLISFPFSHAEEGEHGVPATLAVLAGTEVIGQLRCELQRSEIPVRNRYQEVSINAEGGLYLQAKCGAAPALPVVLRARINAHPIGYFAVMDTKKGRFVKLQSETPRTKAQTPLGIENANLLKIHYELQVPASYSGKLITIEYRTPNRNNERQMGWRLALGVPGGWRPILTAEDSEPQASVPSAPAAPPSSWPLRSSMPPPLSVSSSARPSSTPVPAVRSSVPASSPHVGAPQPVPAERSSQPPLIRSLRYIRNAPGIDLGPIEGASVIETKRVFNLFEKNQVLIVDLGNDSREGFAGHMETMLFTWGRMMDTARDQETKFGGSSFSSWQEAWHRHVRLVLPPETKDPLPSPHRVRRDDFENLDLDRGLMGYTVVWSTTHNHVIIGKISEAKQFEEKAWWLEHDGKPLTLEIAHDLLRRYAFEQQPGRGRWVSFMPVPARLRTQLVNHYDGMAAEDEAPL